MRITEFKEIKLEDYGLIPRDDVFFLRIDPEDLSCALQDILNELGNFSWLGKFDKDFLQASMKVNAQKTCDSLKEKFYDKNGDPIIAEAGEYIVENLPGTNYTGFTQAAVSSVFPSFGDGFVAIALFFFAFTTIMAYYYYAETNITYIFRHKNTKLYIWILRVFFLIATYYGTVKSAETAWAIGDIDF